jgi:hypothetical protein
MGKNIEIYPMDHSPDSVGDDNEKATTVVADDWEETLKHIGGSQSDDWNHVLGNQALQSLWVEQPSVCRHRHCKETPARPSATGSSPTKKPIGTLWSGQVAPHGAYRLALGVDSCKLAYVDL